MEKTFNPHQYTLKNLLIRTPRIYLDPGGISSLMNGPDSHRP